jgi:hypothetical protein
MSAQHIAASSSKKHVKRMCSLINSQLPFDALHHIDAICNIETIFLNKKEIPWLCRGISFLLIPMLHRHRNTGRQLPHIRFQVFAESE